MRNFAVITNVVIKRGGVQCISHRLIYYTLCFKQRPFPIMQRPAAFNRMNKEEYRRSHTGTVHIKKNMKRKKGMLCFGKP